VQLQPRSDLAFLASSLIFRMTIQGSGQKTRKGVSVNPSATSLAESSHEGGCQGALSVVDRHEPILFAVSLLGSSLETRKQTRLAFASEMPLVSRRIPGSLRWS
jgi:hypothetical protein